MESTLAKAEFSWTSTPLRVRYAETDQMGVVYYSNYFIWFEIGRTDYCRQRGFQYKEMELSDGLYIMVAEARCRYKAPARYDDDLQVRTCLREVRNRVLVFGYEVYRQPGDEVLAEGETVHVVTDHEGRPRALPDKYRELFLAGRPMHRAVKRGLAAKAETCSQTVRFASSHRSKCEAPDS